MIERYTNRALINQTRVGYSMAYGSHEEPVWEGYALGHVNILTGPISHIEMDFGPVQSATVETVNTDNVETAYSADNYYLDNFDEDIKPRIVFNADASSPSSLRYKDAWKVTYVAGYGSSATDVPADIRRALIMLAGYLWGNRGACDGDCIASCGAGSRLEGFRLGSILS